MQFPNSPVIDQEYAAPNGRSYKWDGEKWTAIVTPPAPSTPPIEQVYPIGSIYINASVSTNPATLFGFGTWVAFGAGRVPVGYNSSDTNFNAAEKTGGSANAIIVGHQHSFSTTTSTNGSHTHSMNFYGTSGANTGAGGYTGSYSNYTNMDAAGSHTHTVSGWTDSTGSDGTNANYQPYITVYMWKRTA